jgi:haloacetate dehalogenase
MNGFDGFTLETVDTPAARLRLRRGGSGPPLLLLHGNPQTHAMWHRVAAPLARHFTVIAPDLRGYGGSQKFPASADHAAYAKRAMARDMVDLMRSLGHARFLVGAHDRGARVAHRMAIDHPAAVERLCVMDIVPTIEHFERTDMAFAMGYYHWFFLAQPHPGPEEMINRDPRAWFFFQTNREPKPRGFFHPDAEADYLAALDDSATVTAICEDYRAAATIDLVHDRESRAAGARITCPLLVLWGAKGRIAQWYDALALWRRYADGPISGGAVPSGHYLPEEAPDDVLAHLLPFLGVDATIGGRPLC